ncbi:MAG: hypothetical protein ACI3VJ_05200 [Hominicoprocola sp.]
MRDFHDGYAHGHVLHVHVFCRARKENKRWHCLKRRHDLFFKPGDENLPVFIIFKGGNGDESIPARTACFQHLLEANVRRQFAFHYDNTTISSYYE